MSGRSTPYLRRLVQFGEECLVSPYVPHSWWHEFGRQAMVRRLKTKGFPQLWGWLFVTLTVDPSEFEGADCPELAAYVAGNDRLRRCVHCLRQTYAIKRWFWKFELHESGYPHWHLGLDTRDFIANADVQDAWGLGFTKTRRVERERDFRYLFKYVSKAAGEVPEWLLNHPKRIRIFQTSRGFYGQAIAKAGGASRVPDAPFEPRDVKTLADKFQEWSRRVTLRARDSSFRASAAELADSVESYPSLFISCVSNGGRALDAYHVAVSLDQIPEIIKPWKPKPSRSPQPTKLYPSTLLLGRCRMDRISLGALPSQLSRGPGAKTVGAVLCL